MKKENKVNIFFASRFLQFQQAILFWFFCLQFLFHRGSRVLMFFMFQRAKSCSNGGED